MNENSDKNLNEKDSDFVVISILVTIVIIGLWIGTYFLLKDKPEVTRGTFGDMFGSINALFSGLALAGIILTILLQRKELKLQRQELMDTRLEFKTQNETLKLQRFENTFFSLLNQHHQIVNAIDFRYYKRKEKERKTYLGGMFGGGGQPTSTPSEEKEIVIINGRDVFRYLYNQMIDDLKGDENSFESIYLKHYERAQTDFGHYFRSLYRMIKIVHQTDFFYDIKKVNEKEIFDIKYKYTSIIRSQLSDYELLWIFYNCLSENGIEKFKPLIEEYSLFKNIPKNHIAFQSHLLKYNDKAYNPI